MSEKKTIFDLDSKFQTSSPFDNWMKPREESLEIEKQIIAQQAYAASSTPDESPYESGDIFLFNYDQLFLVRKYGEKGQKILWKTSARSGNGKYLNDPRYSDVKYDAEKHLGGPIPKGWYYLGLGDFEADKTSSDKKIKDGVQYKGYQPNRSGGAWGEWAKDLYPYKNIFTGTDTLGRDEFFLHEDGNEREGGNAVGSGGCVATTMDEKGIRLVMRDVKKAYELGDTYIYLLADPTFRIPEIILFHKVVEGDTLYSLSRMYGVTIKSIQKTNKLKGNTIVKGTLLMIRKQEVI